MHFFWLCVCAGIQSAVALLQIWISVSLIIWKYSYFRISLFLSLLRSVGNLNSFLVHILFSSDMFIMMCRLLFSVIVWKLDVKRYSTIASFFRIQFICVKSAEILLKRIRDESSFWLRWLLSFFRTPNDRFLFCVFRTEIVMRLTFLLHIPKMLIFVESTPVNKFPNKNFIYFSWLNFQSRPSSVYWSTHTYIHKHASLTEIQIRLINYNISIYWYWTSIEIVCTLC